MQETQFIEWPPRPSATQPLVRRVRSQKARGILSIRDAHLLDPLGFWYSPFATQFIRASRVYPHEPRPAFPFFARPCPTRPRHGFVESRLVHNEQQWNQMLNEIKASGEPDVEVVCMDFISAKWSAILTPGGLVVGPGNDGATSGRDSVTIPAQAASQAVFTKTFSLRNKDAGVKTSPYVELVANDEALHIVQLRDGPKTQLTDRYVPEPTLVKAVVKAEGDLLDWEKKASAFAKGTVVWHPGGALSSHYGVHCVINKVPILCTADPPNIGETLECVKPNDMGAPDYLLLAKLIIGYDRWIRGIKTRRDEDPDHGHDSFNQLCKIAIATLHAQSTWGKDEHLIRLRALSAITTARLASMGVFGELRHWDHSGPGSDGKERRTPTLGVADPDAEEFVCRGSVYREAARMDLTQVARFLVLAEKDYKTSGWEEGYGGRKWAACARATLRLVTAIAKFLNQPGEKTWREVVSKQNQVVHVAHNGGVLLSKFVSQDSLDRIARVPSYGFAVHMLGKFIVGPIRPKAAGTWFAQRFARKVLLSATPEKKAKKTAEPVLVPVPARPVA